MKQADIADVIKTSLNADQIGHLDTVQLGEPGLRAFEPIHHAVIMLQHLIAMAHTTWRIS